MNILSISRIDCAACGYFLSKAVSRYTEHESRMVRLKDRNKYRFPTDIVKPSDDQLTLLWNWADVIHVQDFAWPMMPRGLGPTDKPTVVTFHGSAYRDNHVKHDRACKNSGWLKMTSTLDLTLLGGAEWMPNTRLNLDRFSTQHRSDFVVAHAPTNRVIKSTHSVERVLGNLSGITLDVIEDTTYEACLQRKARASVVVDQFKLGYGCNAIEAWAMGSVVVANARKATLEAMREEIGYIPFVVSTIKGLPRTIKRLRDDRTFYTEALERGRQFFFDYHRPQVVAQRAVAFYEQAYERFDHSQVQVQLERAGMVRVKYVGRSTGLMTFWGAVSGRRYEFGGSKRFGMVDERDLATGRSNNPGLLEITEGRIRPFARV